jgi:hypothetical protein
MSASGCTGPGVRVYGYLSPGVRVSESGRVNLTPAVRMSQLCRLQTLSDPL